MRKLQGFRTLIFNVLAVTATWISQNFDLPISLEHQETIGVVIIAIGNIVLRFFTKTPIGQHTPHKLSSELPNKHKH